MRGVSNLARQSNAPIPPDNLKRKLPLAPAGQEEFFHLLGDEVAFRFGLAAWKRFLMENGRTEQEADQQTARYGKECFPITAEAHPAALAQAGFRVVELFWFSQMQVGFYAIR